MSLSTRGPSAGHTLDVHAIVPLTRANGPGWRAALWLQGCTLRCAGCFNAATHAKRGQRMSVDDVLHELLHQAPRIEGITISGGEPLQQSGALLALLQRVRQETSLGVILFSGYAWAAAQRHAEVLALVDVVLAGPYEARHHLGRGLLGSSNKTIHRISERYTEAELRATPLTEVQILPDGDIVLTGIDPLAS